MAMETIPSTPLLPTSWAGNALGNTINATAPKKGMIFAAPKTGVITHLWVFVNSGTAVQMRYSLQTVTANYDPSGTLVAGSVAAVSNANSNNGYWLPVGNAALSAGDYLAAVTEFDSTTSSVAYAYFTGGYSYAQGTQYTASTSTWGKTNQPLAYGLRYSDGTEYPIGNPIKGISTPSYQMGTNPNERGNRFKLPYASRLSGWWYFGQAAGSVPFEARLYDMTDTLLFSRAYNSNQVLGTAGLNRFDFDTTFNLAADTWYRFVVKATSSIGNWNTREILIVSQGLVNNMEGGANFYSTYRGASGVWTDDPLAKHQIVPCINGIDVGSAAGTATTSSIFGSSIISAGGRTT